MTTINRQDFVNKLEFANNAISRNDTIEQSSMFVFRNNKLITFDGEVMIQTDSPLDIECAVPSKELLSILKKFPDEELVYSFNDSELIFKGKRRKAGITIIPEIHLPSHEVSKPGKMKKVNPKLSDYLLKSAKMCSNNDMEPRTTHVHVTSGLVEATDSYRICRYKAKTGIAESCLIHASNITKICKQKILSSSVKHGWIHFEMENGFTASIVLSMDDYFPADRLNSLLEVSGDEIEFPKELKQVVSRAEVMNDTDDGKFTIMIKPGMLKITSRKETGWFTETIKVKYKGESFSFCIHPYLLNDLLTRGNNAFLTEDKIGFSDKEFVFVAALDSEE